MGLYLVISLCLCMTTSALCKPSASQVQIEKQRLVKLPRSDFQEILKMNEQRGSIEETQRILQEIERINTALGYTRRMSVAFPRNNNEEFFYPRPPYHPLYQAKEGAQPRWIDEHKNQHISREIINQRTFYAPQAVFMYPLTFDPQRQMENYRANRYVAGPGARKSYDKPILEQDVTKIIEYTPNVVDRRFSKTILAKNAHKTGELRQVPDSVEQPEESSLIDEIVDEFAKLGSSVGVDVGVGVDALVGSEDEDDEDKEDEEDDEEELKEDAQKEPANPPLLNDKFLNNQQLKKKIEEHDLLKNYSLTFGEARSAMDVKNEQGQEKQLNVSAFPFAQDIQNIFRRKPTTEPAKAQSAEDYDDKVSEVGKAPPTLLSTFANSFRPRDQELANATLSQGGLVIQRLRVRQGGIAIAGPGGVATAGSGGTAIVGPGGVALTHPRGLAIGGPGAKVYELPETVDLQQAAIKIAGRSLQIPEHGVLVATGPVVYYHAD